VSNTSTTTSSGGVGVFGLLGVAFVVLKLTGYIDWSWWLVLLPFYVGLLILLVILLIGGVVFGIATLADRRAAKKRKRV
jgi:cell division protein FtsX